VTRRWLVIIPLLLVLSPARAQTGQELFEICTNGFAEQLSCLSYISGFLAGMRAGADLHGEICLPETLTGADASEIFVETLADIKTAQVEGRIPPGPNPFFTQPQNAALAASLGLRFPCPKVNTK
jgi:hypothetical protein